MKSLSGHTSLVLIVDNGSEHLCIINPRRTCAARVTVVVLSVCLSATILALQATGGL